MRVDEIILLNENGCDGEGKKRETIKLRSSSNNIE